MLVVICLLVSTLQGEYEQTILQIIPTLRGSTHCFFLLLVFFKLLMTYILPSIHSRLLSAFLLLLEYKSIVF